MDLQLKTITPLHVGNGEELHSLNYVVYNKRFYHISSARFYEFLRELGKKEYVDAFSKWTLDLSSEIDELRDRVRRTRDRNEKRDHNQQLSYLNRQFNYLGFAEQINEKNAFVHFLQKNIKSADMAANDRPKQQIRGMMRIANSGRAYLPGSSLKGAIRTALFYHILENHIPLKKTEQLLDEAIRTTRRSKQNADRSRKRFNLTREAKNFATDLVHLAFFCRRRNSRGQVKENDEMLDLMKLLLVSDSYPVDNKETLENMDSYLVTKVKDKRDRSKTNVIADKQRQPPSVEAIAAGQKLMEAKLNFNVEFLYNLKFNTRKKDDGIKIGSETVWIDIEQKTEQIFGLKMADIEPKSDADRPAYFQKLEEKVLQHIVTCVRKFSQKQLLKSKEWLDNFTEHDRAGRFTGDIESGFERVLRYYNNNLINLGYASGFDATTVFHYLFDNQKPQLKEIMELFGIGDKPGADRNRRPGETYKANPDNFPKSRRLITRRNEIMPLGWLEIMNGPEIPAAEQKRPAAFVEPQQEKEPAKAEYLRGKLKTGVVLDAEVLNAKQVKLYIAEGNLQTVAVRYGAKGFAPEQTGTIVQVKVGTVNKKKQVLSVGFKGFK